MSGYGDRIRTYDLQVMSFEWRLYTGSCPTGPSERGDGRLGACQQRFQSVRFARYSAQELAAASESLLFGTVGDTDQRIQGNWATRRWCRNKSAGTSSATTKAAPPR